MTTETAEKRRAYSAGRILGLTQLLSGWVIPALGGALVVRYLFPSATDPFEPAADSFVASLAAGYAPALWGFFFIAFAWVARYWLERVPAGLPHGQQVEAPTARAPWAFAGAIGLVLTGFLVRTCLYQSYRVFGSSMLPNLAAGSYVVVNKVAYGLKLPGLTRFGARLPKRGDIVVFQNPEDPTQEVVKRVIGLPGDRIRIMGSRPVIDEWAPPACRAGLYPLVTAEMTGNVWLFQEFLEDRVFSALLPLVADPAEETVDYRVQPGEVFVLGDNRSVSLDSRAWQHGHGGGLPTTAIIGRVERVLFEADQNGHPHLAHAFARVDRTLNLREMDSTRLDSNLAACLKLKPKDTAPPSAIGATAK